MGWDGEYLWSGDRHEDVQRRAERDLSGWDEGRGEEGRGEERREGRRRRATCWKRQRHDVEGRRRILNTILTSITGR